ncbi:hypothetical protein FQN60_016724, partial [Etheostoma spectabile]
MIHSKPEGDEGLVMAAEAPQNMILCVIEADRVRRLKLSSRPASVDALIDEQQLELDCDFSLKYEDPDFDGQLTCLVDIEELPQKACVHISLTYDSSSLASTDTLSDVSSPERLSRRPPVVKLASTIYGFKAYPSDKEIAMVAEALVRTHSCLKVAGSNSGWSGWKNSIKSKMGNYRTKMKRAGCQEVTVNAGKRSQKNPDNEPSHSNIKRPKRAEVNFLPNFPQEEDPSSLDQLRQAIVEEVKKTERNLPLISKMMQTTKYMMSTQDGPLFSMPFLFIYLRVIPVVASHTHCTAREEKKIKQRRGRGKESETPENHSFFPTSEIVTDSHRAVPPRGLCIVTGAAL